MAKRPSMKLADSLRPALLTREAQQLALVAALSVAALVFAPRWLQVGAGVVDAAVALASLVGVAVGWRVSRRTPALALYGPAAAAFALLALLNLRG